MKNEWISPIYFPTKIIFVDDNVNYLEQLRYKFSRKKHLDIYSDPQKAYEFLSEKYTSKPFTNNCIQEFEDNSVDNRILNVNLRALRQEIHNPDRYNEIAVLVLDFAMPNLNGGELAEKLKGYPFKIILLTGEADTKIAVELFNKGLISAYIRKDDPDFDSVLDAMIINLQQEYFKKQSTIIINSLEQTPDIQRKWFKDPSFKKLFQKICDENNIVEYYLLDEQGSYQLLDAEGNVSFLAVADEEMMETYAMFAEDDKASETMVNDLKSKKIIPFFYSDDDFDTRPSEWEKYLHPARLLKGNDNYYYAYITDTKTYDVDTSKIVSYRDFIKMQEKK